MKNLSVKLKMNIILALVLALALVELFVSAKSLDSMKNKSLETMEDSIRENYDQNIREQVENALTVLDSVNRQYENGTYTLDEAKKVAADLIRDVR